LGALDVAWSMQIALFQHQAVWPRRKHWSIRLSQKTKTQA
jgi:hypothetical protein